MKRKDFFKILGAGSLTALLSKKQIEKRVPNTMFISDNEAVRIIDTAKHAEYPVLPDECYNPMKILRYKESGMKIETIATGRMRTVDGVIQQEVMDVNDNSKTAWINSVVGHC